VVLQHAATAEPNLLTADQLRKDLQLEHSIVGLTHRKNLVLGLVPPLPLTEVGDLRLAVVPHRLTLETAQPEHPDFLLHGLLQVNLLVYLHDLYHWIPTRPLPLPLPPAGFLIAEDLREAALRADAELLVGRVFGGDGDGVSRLHTQVVILRIQSCLKPSLIVGEVGSVTLPVGALPETLSGSLLERVGGIEDCAVLFPQKLS
jgi:hypothetical protein